MLRKCLSLTHVDIVLLALPVVILSNRMRVFRTFAGAANIFSSPFFRRRCYVVSRYFLYPETATREKGLRCSLKGLSVQKAYQVDKCVE